MTMSLPTAIAGYFAADRDRDTVGIAQHFTATASVKDEGKIHTGRAAIQSWMSHSWETYNATAKPIAIADDGVAQVVTSHVEGNFPGSPIDLRFHFVLEGGLIAELEVTG